MCVSLFLTGMMVMPLGLIQKAEAQPFDEVWTTESQRTIDNVVLRQGTAADPYEILCEGELLITPTGLLQFSQHVQLYMTDGAVTDAAIQVDGNFILLDGSSVLPEVSGQTYDFEVRGTFISASSVEKNVVSGMWGTDETERCGLQMLRGSIGSISDTIIRGCQGTGLFIDDCQPFVSDCEVRDNAGAGVYVNGFQADPTIMDCDIVGNQIGVKVTNFANADVMSNSIHGNQIGVEFTGLADGMIMNNDVYENGQVGISIKDCSPDVIQNRVYGNQPEYPRLEGGPNKWAVIVMPDYHLVGPPLAEIALRTYRIFKEKGYTDENIEFFLEHGDTFPTDVVDFEGEAASDIDNFLGVMDELAGKMDNGDELFIVLVGHGMPEGFVFDEYYVGEEPFQIRLFKTLSVEMLDDKLDAVQDKEVKTTVFDFSCYSGIFINELVKPNRIVIATSGDDRTRSPLSDPGKYAFTERFWDNIENGETLIEAFSDSYINEPFEHYNRPRMFNSYLNQGGISTINSHSTISDNILFDNTYSEIVMSGCYGVSIDRNWISTSRTNGIMILDGAGQIDANTITVDDIGKGIVASYTLSTTVSDCTFSSSEFADNIYYLHSGGQIQRCDIIGGRYGIYVHSGDYKNYLPDGIETSIESTTIRDNTVFGIRFGTASGAISDCEIVNSPCIDLLFGHLAGISVLESDLLIDETSIIGSIKDGVHIDNSHVFIEASPQIIMSNTEVRDSVEKGAKLYWTENSVIQDCAFSGNTDIGLNLVRTTGTLVTNTIFQKNGVGIELRDASDNNQIFHNAFYSNGVHAIDSSSGTNAWDDEYPSGGNFWDDHTTPDQKMGPDQRISGSDGIVDVPRPVDGGVAEDRYPFTMEDGWLPPLPPQNLNLHKVVSGIELAWDHPVGSPARTMYYVFRSSDRFDFDFTSGIPVWPNQNSWVDPDPSDGGTTTVQFYIVKAWNPRGYSAESTMGVWTKKTFTAYEENILGAPHQNVVWLGLPYKCSNLKLDGTGYLERASDMVKAIEGGLSTADKILEVRKWKGGPAEDWYSYSYSDGAWDTPMSKKDFKIDPGDGLALVLNVGELGDGGSFDLEIFGHDIRSTQIYWAYELNDQGAWHKNLHWLSLPYTSGWTTASDVVEYVEGGTGPGTNTKITAIRTWRGDETEGYDELRYLQEPFNAWMGPDFEIWPGDGIAIQLNVDSMGDHGIFEWSMDDGLLLPPVPDEEFDEHFKSLYSVRVESISISPFQLNAGDEATISIAIANDGDLPVGDVKVSAYVHSEPEYLGTQVIDYLGRGQSMVLEFEWMARAGEHEVIVYIDSNGDIVDGYALEASIPVEVNEPPVCGFDIYRHVNVKLTIVGPKDNVLSFSILEDGEPVETLSVTSGHGPVSASILTRIRPEKRYDIDLHYSASHFGCNLVLVEFEGSTTEVIRVPFQTKNGMDQQFTLNVDSQLDKALDGLAYTFDADVSYDPDGSIISYRWNFGDGALGEGPYVEHEYSEPGTYCVSLAVTDDDNAASTTQRDLVIASPDD